MFHKSMEYRKRNSLQNRIAIASLAVLVLALLGASRLSAQTGATYNFDDGTADGWTSFNGASTPVATNVAAYSGTYSLETTTNSGGQGGPSISVTSLLQPGAQYTITAYMMLTPGEDASTANLTMQRSDPNCSGGVCYDTIGTYQVPVSASGWVQIGGSYTVSPTATGLTLYAQLVGATSPQSFYLDQVVITETAPALPVYTYTFADGGLDGWAPFGSVTLTNAVSPIVDPMGNTHSLLTTNRTAGYMGPSLNLLSLKGVVAGAIYQVSAYVMLADADSSNPTATVSTKTTNCANSSGIYNNIATSGPLSNTAWTQVQGTFSFSNVPGAPTGLTLYIQSSSASDSFYISDVVIAEVVPPPNPNTQDNTGITSTFEDGGLDGWSSRSGSSVLTNTTAVAHTGSNALEVSGRVANWDGGQISVNNKMYPGSTYDLSLWIMLQPTDGSSHVINLSLQTTLNGTTSYNTVSSYPGTTVPADGSWHQITVSHFNMSYPYSPGQAFLYVQTVPSSGNDLVSFYLDDFQLTYDAPPVIQTNIPSIYQSYAGLFPVGAAINMSDVSGPHEQLLTMHFDSITPDNDLKWSSVEPSLGNFNFANGDTEVGVAVCNNMKVRGHNLVWATGAQTPSYAFGDGTNSPANQATVTANIQEHIQNEVQHFGTQIYAWDVVNEPLDPSQPDCLFHGPFYQVLGKSYIDVALEAARQYAPAGTKLFINDYSTTDSNRLACLVKVVKDLRSRGIPLDGIGHEMHNAINYPSTQQMTTTLQTVHKNFPDLDQQITELDESVYNAGDVTSNYGSNIPPSVLAEQGWLYKGYFDVFRSLAKKDRITGVTFWGMADDDTWLDGFPVARTDYPLPFDMNLQAKPAYWGIVDPTQLPGYGLSFAVTGKTGPKNAQVWTITATDGNVGTAYGTQINGFQLWQVGGPRCNPVVTPPTAYPVLLGDIAVGSSASASFTVNWDSCSPAARFILKMPWSSATYDTGTFIKVAHF